MRLFESSYQRPLPASPAIDRSNSEVEDLLTASPDASPESPDDNPRKRYVNKDEIC